MSHFKLLASTGLLLLATSSAFAAQPADRNPDKPGLGWGSGGHNGQMVGAPGPIAGVGLPILAVAGAYVWVRNRRRNRPDKPSD
jgi:hypothetical protein